MSSDQISAVMGRPVSLVEVDHSVGVTAYQECVFHLEFQDLAGDWNGPPDVTVMSVDSKRVAEEGRAGSMFDVTGAEDLVARPEWGSEGVLIDGPEFYEAFFETRDRLWRVDIATAEGSGLVRPTAEQKIEIKSQIESIVELMLNPDD